MTDIVEKAFVAIAVFVFAFAFGCQGLNSHRIPPAQAQTDFGPDTVRDGQDDFSGTLPDVSTAIGHRGSVEAHTSGA